MANHANVFRRNKTIILVNSLWEMWIDHLYYISRELAGIRTMFHCQWKVGLMCMLTLGIAFFVLRSRWSDDVEACNTRDHYTRFNHNTARATSTSLIMRLRITAYWSRLQSYSFCLPAPKPSASTTRNWRERGRRRCLIAPEAKRKCLPDSECVRVMFVQASARTRIPQLHGVRATRTWRARQSS